jgi:hypothetical protein
MGQSGDIILVHGYKQLCAWIKASPEIKAALAYRTR